MQKQLFILSTAALALLFGSCNKGDSKFEGYTKAENGLYYKFYKQNESGAKAKEGDVLQMSYQFKLQKNDSVVMDSKNFSRNGTGIGEVSVLKPSFRGSFEDALMMLCAGDSASFIAPADSFYMKSLHYNELPPYIKQGDYIKGTFAVKSIKSEAEFKAEQKKAMEQQQALVKEREAEETPAREKWLAEHKITAKPTASGLYYVEIKKGSGPNPKETDMVTVHYTGTLLDGTKFDSSVDRGQPAEFPLNGVIKGWIEGLQLMKKGGKAMLIIPSSLGYGGNGGGPIPPFSTLVFDVELLDIKPAPTQPAAPNMNPGK
jgi:FKBP-type peptidyl-prolyl cis-trans isomerase